MNEKKRYLTLTLAILLVIGTLLLAACNETQETGTTKETHIDAVTESQTETQTEAHQHTPVTDEEKPATCTEPGLTEGSHCSECGQILVAQTEIPAKGHTVVTEAGKPATCTEPGLTDSSHCSECGEVLSTQQEIPATGHQYAEVVIPPTETEPGYTAHVCVSCGDAYVDNYTSPTASVGLEFYLNLDGQSYTVKGIGTCTDTEIVIPSVHDGKPVTGIDSHAFAYCTQITGITIPDSVTNVGVGAFWKCRNLLRMEGPEDIIKEIRYSIRKDSTVFYVGPDAWDPASRFYDSLEEAVADNPDGAVIGFCDDVTFEEPIHLPETGKFFIELDSMQDVEISIDAGLVLEYWTSCAVYYVYANDLSAALETYESSMVSSNNPKLWVFRETDGLKAGRYTVTNVNEMIAGAEPEYRFDYFEGLSNWGRKYVANASWDDKTYYFYTLQEAMDAAQSDNQVVRIYVLRDCEATLEDKLLDLPWNNNYYRIPYNYHYVDGYFSRGVTYDDTMGGYCFYSSLEFLSAQPGLVDTYCWIWSDEEGYMPGKYHITANVQNLGSEADVFDPETGNYYVMHVGQYVYTLVEGVSFDQFFEDMRCYVFRGMISPGVSV